MVEEKVAANMPVPRVMKFPVSAIIGRGVGVRAARPLSLREKETREEVFSCFPDSR